MLTVRADLPGTAVGLFGENTMTRQLTRSHEHFQRALKRLPLGVASNFRYWGEDRTIYVKHGRGARIVDLDDNVYVDYRMGYGPAILGYADARVDEAARAGMEVGGVFALSTERELSVAERIARMVPAAELVRFSNSGTEAVMAALRLARAYTGKDDYVILEGSYHGLFDAAMWYTPMDKWSQVGDPQVVPYSEGMPLSTRSFAHFVQANDANQLEDVFKRHAGRIACLLIEPIMGNCLGIAAEPEYVRAARELCDRYGVVLIIDEVKTGFRVARGGVQELYGVKADLCTFAKAVANGYPISVLAGPRGDHAQDRQGRRTRRHLHRALGVAGGGGQDPRDPRPDRCAGAHRALRHAAAPGHARDPQGARHRAQLRRPSVDERVVLCARSAAHLSRLEGQRLHLLRCYRARAAR